MDNIPTDSEIRARSTALRRIVSILLISLAVLLLMERFGTDLLQAFRYGMQAGTRQHVLIQGLTAVPELCYLLALFWIRQALADFASGAFYSETISRMLRRVGGMLAVGALLNVFALPSLLTLAGKGPGYLIAYDVTGLVLGAVGLSLIVIANVLTRAAALQTELDGIF